MRLLLAALLLAAGCGSSASATRTDVRPVDEDLLQLVPSGAELLLDLDGDIRSWPPSARLMALLPDVATATLDAAGLKLGDFDQLVLALGGVGTDDAWQVALVHADVEWPKAAPVLGGDTQSDYRGLTLHEGTRAAVLLEARLFAVGAPAAVRRVVDLYRGESQSARTAPRDAILRAALERVPSAKTGRAALIGGLLLDEPVRQALEAPQWMTELSWVSIALAVGDGFDLELIARALGKAEAHDCATDATKALVELARRQLVRLLGLQKFIEPVRIVARDDEVRLVLRLGERSTSDLLSHFEALHQAAGSHGP